MAGWNATGRLSAHWKKVGGRDKLAELTGIGPTTLSAYNSGARRLGVGNAERIAAALEITIFDLGAPTAAQAAAQAATLLERVAALEADLADAQRQIDALRRHQGGAE